MNARRRVFEWASVKVLSEWVRCRIFELMRGRSNKDSWKPTKAYLHPIHHCYCARGLSIKGCCVKGVLTKGSYVVLSIVTQVSLQLACQVRVRFPEPWSQSTRMRFFMIVLKASQSGKHFGFLCVLFPCLLHLFTLFVAKFVTLCKP
jgi:hypothetical protein